MTIRKIADLPKPSEGWKKGPWVPPCLHPEHNPPGSICLPPGVYEHECPGCHNKQVFRVDGFFCSTVAG